MPGTLLMCGADCPLVAVTGHFFSSPSRGLAPSCGRLWHAPCGDTDRANLNLPAVGTNRLPFLLCLQDTFVIINFPRRPPPTLYRITKREAERKGPHRFSFCFLSPLLLTALSRCENSVPVFTYSIHPLRQPPVRRGGCLRGPVVIFPFSKVGALFVVSARMS